MLFGWLLLTVSGSIIFGHICDDQSWLNNFITLVKPENFQTYRPLFLPPVKAQIHIFLSFFLSVFQFFHLLNDVKFTLQECWKVLIIDRKCAEILGWRMLCKCRMFWLIMQIWVVTWITKGAMRQAQSFPSKLHGKICLKFTFVLSVENLVLIEHCHGVHTLQGKVTTKGWEETASSCVREDLD